MKSLRVSIGLCLLATTLLFVSCNEPTYIVYVDNNPCSFKTWDGEIIDDLWLYPKDRVVLVNTTTSELKIKFGQGNTVFDEAEVVIPSKKRAFLTVKADATGETGYEISPCLSTLPGAPKAKVGDPP